MPFASLPFDGSPGSPWLLVPAEVRNAFDLVLCAGTSIDRTGFGAPLLGVKSGCNEAFVVKVDDGESDNVLAAVRAADRAGGVREGVVERELLRPVLRGETVRAWRVLATTEWMVWTHGDTNEDVATPIVELPAHAAAWLAPWRHRLEARSDVKNRLPWWSLFRTPSAARGGARVIWADLGRRPRAAVLSAGDRSVPLNSCYVVRVQDADDGHALAALLNSEVAAAWLNVIAEPAASGYRRYLGWTVGMLPVPPDWPRARSLLAPIGRAAARGSGPRRAC